MARQFMKLPCDILARTDLRMTAKVVYAVLWDAVRGRGSARLGYHAIAKRAGIGRTAVIEAIVQLARLTDLVVERGRGAGRANTYSFALECGSESALPGRPESDTPPVRIPTTPHSESGPPLVRNPDSFQSKTKRTTKKKAKRARAPTFSWKEIQPRIKGTCLDTPEFADTWMAWVAHRQEKRKPLTATTVSRQIRRLKEYGLKLATRAIEHSIEQGYQGFNRDWLPENKAPGSGAPADRPFDPTARYDIRGNRIPDAFLEQSQGKA